MNLFPISLKLLKLDSMRTGTALAVMLSALAASPSSGLADDGPNAYRQTNLVSNGALPASHTDSNLVNAWGVAFNPNAFVWVADNGTGVSTLYDGLGNPQRLVVTIPDGSPTGIVFNGSPNFVVSKGSASGPAAFIFATETGFIDAWNPTVDATNAVTAVDNSKNGAVYKGIATAANGTARFIYATDFHNARVDVFDKDFHPVSLSPSAFTDPQIPEGFAPFGIQNISGNLYVTYAKQDADKHDDVAGRGNGFVDIYDPQGRLIRHLVARGPLNSPWGVALAPADFGKFSNMLLVGNFGDGTIDAFELPSGNFRGLVKGANGRPLVIDGLWGIAFGNGVQNQPTNALFFAAGPNDEKDGLYGRIDPPSAR